MEVVQTYITKAIEIFGLDAFYKANFRIYIPYLFAALLIAIVYYWIHFRGKERPGLLPFLFPNKIWSNPSIKTDLAFFIFNNLIKAVLILPNILAHTTFAYTVVLGLEYFNGLNDTILLSSSTLTMMYSLVYIIISDLSRFILHYYLHTSKSLWNIHKVHHSAPVLTPFSLYRIHTIEFLLYKIRSILIFGLISGSFFYFFRTSIEPMKILEVHAIIFLFNILGANLRHSHIPISYGRFLEHLLISPAQHQIHHSSDPKHINKNFGSIFAIWDWMAGTLIIWDKKLNIDFGINEKEAVPLVSFKENLLYPFKKLIGR